jgi:hypothetical protein
VLADLVVWGLMAGWLVLIGVGLVRWTSLTWASQGRLIFPAISAIGVLLAAGLGQWWRRLPMLAAAGMAALTAAVPFAVIRPHYQPPEALTPADIQAIQYPLGQGRGVDFGGELRLLGYDLPVAAAQPGQALRLRLYWQALTAMDRNWSIFVHVVDDAGIIIAQRDRYPGMGALATTLLAPGRTWADDYVIPLPEAIYAPSPAQIRVGLYDLLDGARLGVAGQAGDALDLAPVSVTARPAVQVEGLGEIPNPFRQNFGGEIELIGYGMDRRVLRPGETLRLTLYWQALRAVPVNYSVFAHVRGLGETLWAGADAWPQQGAAPTSTWQPGEVLVDSFDLVLKPDTPPETYEVEVGLYDADGNRLQAVADDGRPTDADYVFLSRIRVLP